MRFRHWFSSAFSLALPIAASALTGCATSTFQDLSPSVRTFSDSGRTRTSEYYVGLDLDFAIQDDAPHVPAPTNATPMP
jgi:hypothetical protein